MTLWQQLSWGYLQLNYNCDSKCSSKQVSPVLKTGAYHRLCNYRMSISAVRNFRQLTVVQVSSSLAALRICVERSGRCSVTFWKVDSALFSILALCFFGEKHIAFTFPSFFWTLKEKHSEPFLDIIVGLRFWIYPITDGGVEGCDDWGGNEDLKSIFFTLSEASE